MTIHSSAIISDGVELGADVVVGPHAVLLGPCQIGDGVRIGPGCVIGSAPEITGATQNIALNGDLAHHGVVIGPGSVIRELSTVQQGSLAPTQIGAGCWLLSRAYVAHDCVIDDEVTLSAGVAVGGYARIGYGVTLGMNTTVHQRRIIGPVAMVGMSAAVTRDVPPFAKAFGVPARVRGANVIGMTRRGIAGTDAAELDAKYRVGQEPDHRHVTVPELAAAWRWWTSHHAAPVR
ncbi:MAG: UDP-N-acetylglucosamine acyltransferase [Pseudonocardia sp.]|nr:UDP-N-acetylglucosamine acyltransferase [Pseudonocardia sp.]